MAIFNSYVKLPEGNDEEHSQIRWRLGHLRTAESRAATAAEEKTELQLSLGLWFRRNLGYTAVIS